MASFLGWTLWSYHVPVFCRMVAVILVMAAYGAFDELTQPLVGRTAAWADWGADVLGAVVAAVFWPMVNLLVSRIRR